MIKEYVEEIILLLYECQDVELLDIIFKLLHESS